MLHLRVEVSQEEGISTQEVDETRTALNELGLEDTLQVEQSIDQQ